MREKEGGVREREKEISEGEGKIGVSKEGR